MYLKFYKKEVILNKWLIHKKWMNFLAHGKSIPFYIGIDPTADSLHVGHFVSLMVASIMQKHGHKPIILVGGGTASIGDPNRKIFKVWWRKCSDYS